MNIAYICTDFGVPVFGYKGASIHVREMVSAMRKAGHNVTIISPAMHRGKEDEKGSNMGAEGIDSEKAFTTVNWNEASGFSTASGLGNLTCISVLPLANHVQFTRELARLDQFLDIKLRLRQEVRNLLYNMSLFDAVGEYLAEQNIDFVYERYTLFSHSGIQLARKLGVPHILEVNAPLAYEQEKMRGLEMKTFARQMEKRIFQETDRVLVVSKELKEFVKSCDVPDDRIVILPNAVDPERFISTETETPVAENLNFNGHQVIGFVGSLKPWHGTETLLEAFAKLYKDNKNIRLLIVGDGPGRESLEQFSRDNHLEDAVVFTGKISHHDIPKYIDAMDIAVAPYTPNDNFYFSPIKIFEYMMMEKAVVGARIGQVEDIINHRENGMLFEPGNIPQLSDTLNQLVSDQSLCKKLGDTAKAWVRQERTWDNNARQVADIAKNLMERP